MKVSSRLILLPLSCLDNTCLHACLCLWWELEGMQTISGMFSEVFWWEFFLLVFSLIGHLLGQPPLYFLLVSSPCFSVLNFTYYIYTILLELLSCDFVSFVSALREMTITYRNNFWLYILFAWTWILHSKFVVTIIFSFCNNHWLKFNIISF